MEPRLQRRVQRYGWDNASLYYETFWQHQLKPAHDLLMEMAALQPGESVLDEACGTGLVSFFALEKLGPKGRVLGTDLSEKMIEMANALAVEKKENRAQFEWMDAEELRLENNSFDVALCALGLMYMPDPRKALKEMHRVLKPGGRAVAAVWGQRKNAAGLSFLKLWASMSPPKSALCFLTWAIRKYWNSILKRPDLRISASNGSAQCFPIKMKKRPWGQLMMEARWHWSIVNSAKQ